MFPILKYTIRKIGRLITFEPIIVIQNGILLSKNLRKIHYTIDNILQLLREKEVFDINDVETAIIEASGKISVLKKQNKSAVTPEDMNITKNVSDLTFPLIIEGKIISDVLDHLMLDQAWLKQQLTGKDIYDINSVFFASINYKHELQISLKNERDLVVPIIKH